MGTLPCDLEPGKVKFLPRFGGMLRRSTWWIELARGGALNRPALPGVYSQKGVQSPAGHGRSMARMRRKGDLPEKTCRMCQRPFAWRKKWARVWESIETCSDRCRDAARKVRRSQEAS
jgi:hypothetical protein